MTLRYTSYAGMVGTYTIPSYGGCDQRAALPALLNLQNGAMSDTGLPVSAGGCGTVGPRTIGAITDGTSNTIMFAERCHSKLVIPSEFECRGWWSDGEYGDSSVSSFYPPNVGYLFGTVPPNYKNPDGCEGRGNSPVAMSAESLHPGGVNVVFVDGSVHFIKNTINSWNYSAPNMSRSSSNAAGPCFPYSTSGSGIWQALSTIAGGEVISADQM